MVVSRTYLLDDLGSHSHLFADLHGLTTRTLSNTHISTSDRIKSNVHEVSEVLDRLLMNSANVNELEKLEVNTDHGCGLGGRSNLGSNQSGLRFECSQGCKGQRLQLLYVCVRKCIFTKNPESNCRLRQ